MARGVTTSVATAAPTSFELDGKEYFLSPLSDKDFGEYERWVQSRIISIATENLKHIPERLHDSIIKHAYDKAVKVDITSVEALATMATVEGIVKIMCLSLQHRHPDLKEDEVRNLIFSPGNLQKAMRQLEFVNALTTKLADEKKEVQQIKE